MVNIKKYKNTKNTKGCVICGKYRKFKNLKMSRIFGKTLFLSLIYCKYGNEDEKILKKEESIEIQKILVYLKMENL